MDISVLVQVSLNRKKNRRANNFSILTIFDKSIPEITTASQIEGQVIVKQAKLPLANKHCEREKNQYHRGKNQTYLFKCFY